MRRTCTDHSRVLTTPASTKQRCAAHCHAYTNQRFLPISQRRVRAVWLLMYPAASVSAFLPFPCPSSTAVKPLWGIFNEIQPAQRRAAPSSPQTCVGLEGDTISLASCLPIHHNPAEGYSPISSTRSPYSRLCPKSDCESCPQCNVDPSSWETATWLERPVPANTVPGPCLFCSVINSLKLTLLGLWPLALGPGQLLSSTDHQLLITTIDYCAQALQDSRYCAQELKQSK
jgi:hypothetical protein